jgi:hypothetical protein
MKKNRFFKFFYLLYLKLYFHIVTLIHNIFRNNRAYRKKLQLGALIISLSATSLSAGCYPFYVSKCLSMIEEIEIELEDTDGDGLYDYYEREVFETDTSQVDTDYDGTPDGDEDHDADGITNWEYQVKKETPLIAEIQQGQTQKAMILIAAHDYEDIDAKDARGGTALMAAAATGNGEIVEVLLDSGADVIARAKHGRTALGWALEGGYSEVAEILRKSGAME